MKIPFSLFFPPKCDFYNLLRGPNRESADDERREETWKVAIQDEVPFNLRVGHTHAHVHQRRRSRRGGWGRCVGDWNAHGLEENI